MIRLPSKKVGLVALIASTAAAAGPFVTFGPHDVTNLFGVPKSDDGNRVQYGLLLDGECRPAGPRPVLGYWREYDKGLESPLKPLSWLDETAYGIASQAVLASPADGGVGPHVEMRLKMYTSRPVHIWITRSTDGSCHAEARALISGTPAVLKAIFVQLAGPFVSWVEIRGVALADGSSLRERLVR